MSIKEETVTANIENKTAEVGSISSDTASERRQPVQMAQFLLIEIDMKNMNSVVAPLTTRIDAAVSQPQQFQHSKVPATIPAVPDNIRSRAIS